MITLHSWLLLITTSSRPKPALAFPNPSKVSCCRRALLLLDWDGIRGVLLQTAQQVALKTGIFCQKTTTKPADRFWVSQPMVRTALRNIQGSADTCCEDAHPGKAVAQDQAKWKRSLLLTHCPAMLCHVMRSVTGLWFAKSYCFLWCANMGLAEN